MGYFFENDGWNNGAVRSCDVWNNGARRSCTAINLAIWALKLKMLEKTHDVYLGIIMIQFEGGQENMMASHV